MFHHHFRLLLVLIQMMMLKTGAILTDHSCLAEQSHRTADVLAALHCADHDEDEDDVMPELDLGPQKVSFSRCL